MKLFLCLSALVVAAIARPQFAQYYNQPSYKQQVPILAYSNEVNPDGSYAYNYQTGDGINAQESGYLKNAGAGPEREAQTVQGSFSYTAPDGTPITLTYTADENGFRPQGAHLPTPPPIPEAIAKSLNLVSQPQQPYNQYNQYSQNQYRPGNYRGF
ncbi:endocuticle structural glycoprotein SgAbd-2 [Anabrus simplex]|uniref:endocuticle structural glycoprotein SgAbd-2 n=1 Tax=Anabrus simplex TaxID=316456 RepID=UPI0035A2C746